MDEQTRNQGSGFTAFAEPESAPNPFTAQNYPVQPASPLPPMPEAPPVAPMAQVEYAGFWVRYAAVFIDGLILMIPTALLRLFLDESILGTLAQYAVMWAYYIFMTKNYQATLGKQALGLMVLSEKGPELTLGQLVLRETVGKLLSTFTLLIGYIMAAFTDRKRALHDMLAGTVVVYKDPSKKRTGVIIAIIIVVVVGGMIILGILASIVLVSLGSARGKAQDAMVKSSLMSNVPSAILQLDDKGTLVGFKPAKIQSSDCSGDPIASISPDGQDMAIFFESCTTKGKFFCIDLNSSVSEVDQSFAKGQNYSCGADTE